MARRMRWRDLASYVLERMHDEKLQPYQVKFIIAVAVVVGVSTALFVAFCAVLMKCCYVWWKYRRKLQHHASYQGYDSYAVLQAKSQWPVMTYQSCENVQPREFDSLSSSTTDEPYIIETPGDFGKIQFWHEYNIEEEALVVGLIQAKGIVCKTNVQTSFVYPELSLCKDDKVITERKVDSQPMSFGPQWNEEMLFPLDANPLNELTLRVCLFEVDSFSKIHLIGQVSVALKELELGEPNPQWYDLIGEQKPEHEDIGEILLSLNYFPTTRRLTVVIIKGRNLKIESTTGLWGPLIKLLLHVNRNRVSKKRTAMQKKTNNPVYNEAFTFKVSPDALPKVTFKFVVVNKTSHGQDQVIGHVLLGQQVTGSGFSHWNHMLASPRKPVAMWHSIMPL